MAQSDSNGKSETADSRLKQAIEDIAENVSVAGLREAITERVPWIRRIFQIAVAIFFVCALYYIYGVAVEYLRRGYTNEIKIVHDKDSLPLSNVTVCADVTTSKAFLKDNITVPKELAEKVANKTGYTKTEFLDEFSKWISLITVRRNIEQRLFKYFKRLIAANPQMSQYTAFLRSSMPRCRDMLKICKIAGKIFDCCKDAIPLLADGGLCYQIAINYDTNSLQESNSTKRQSVLGETGGLTIEAAVDLDDTPWCRDTASGGFKIFVHPTTVTAILSPLTAPTEAETFVKVTARERILNRVCLPDDYSPALHDGGYYDPFGYKCLSDRLQDATRAVTNCVLPYMYYSPNASTVCGAEQAYMQLNMWSADIRELVKGDGFEKNSKILEMKRKGLEKIEKTEKDIRRESKFRDKCPPRCRYWEYSSTASFVDLAKEKVFPKNFLYSRIHIFYTDFLYQEHEEVLTVNIYLAFFNFGNVIGLYMGLSIVGIFEVIFWFAKYFSAVAGVYRAKRAKPLKRIPVLVRVRQIRCVQVTPL